jgi:hypothetical protein
MKVRLYFFRPYNLLFVGLLLEDNKTSITTRVIDYVSWTEAVKYLVNSLKETYNVKTVTVYDDERQTSYEF